MSFPPPPRIHYYVVGIWILDSERKAVPSWRLKKGLFKCFSSKYQSRTDSLFSSGTINPGQEELKVVVTTRGTQWSHLGKCRWWCWNDWMGGWNTSHTIAFVSSASGRNKEDIVVCFMLFKVSPPKVWVWVMSVTGFLVGFSFIFSPSVMAVESGWKPPSRWMRGSVEGRQWALLLVLHLWGEWSGFFFFF